jgi:hypothetical protein
MITAAEAKEKSLEIIAKNAKEYISKTAEPKIEETTRYGVFHCTTSHPFHSAPLRAKIADLLRAQGFTVTIGNNFYDINWEE